MQYDGWDCDGKNGDCMKQDVAPAGHVAYGRWEDGTSELPGGLEGSGPMAIFAQVNTTACKRLFSLGCVAHTDGAVFQRRDRDPPGHEGAPEIVWKR